MFCLTKQQEAEKTEIAKRLRAAYDELTGATNAFNLIADEARTFAGSIGSDARSAYDEKSERWQEGDAASDADAWIQTFEEIEGELDDAEEYDESKIDAFENLEHNRPFRTARKPKAKPAADEINPNDAESARRDRGLPARDGTGS
jgi:hypothetical protein